MGGVPDVRKSATLGLRRPFLAVSVAVEADSAMVLGDFLEEAAGRGFPLLDRLIGTLNYSVVVVYALRKDEPSYDILGHPEGS